MSATAARASAPMRKGRQRRDEPDRRGFEFARQIRFANAQHDDAGGHNHKREQRSDRAQAACFTQLNSAEKMATPMPVTIDVSHGVWNFGCTRLTNGGNKPSRAML